MNEFPFSRSDPEIKENPQSTTLTARPGPSRIVGEGEMSVLIRSASWEQTSLGPIEGWSQALIWAVNSMLESQFPASVFWGQEMLHFYNDAYVPLSCEKHPRLLGQRAAEAWSEAWHIIGPQFAAVLKDGVSIYQEKVLVPVTRGGRLQDVYWTYSYSPIRDEKSCVCGILIVCHDVTGELNAERERASAAASLQSVLGSITDGVFGLDRDWLYTYCNEQGAAIIGRLSNDLIGTSVWDQFPPAQVPEFEVGFRQAMESGRPVHFEEYYPAEPERWLECHCYPAQPGLTVYFRDITAKRKAAEQIQKSEERYRFISETAEIGYWDWNIVNDVLDWGPVCKRLFGIAQDEKMSYGRFLAAVHPEDRNRTDEAVRACLAGAADYDIEYRTQWLDHSVHWIRAKGNTQMYEGKAVRMAGIAIDISASKRNQEALERSERRLRLAQEAGHLAIGSGVSTRINLSGKAMS